MDLVGTFGDVSIDTVAWRVRVRDREVYLTRTEFAILVVLASRAGQVVSEREIVRQVWGENWFGDENNLKVHVSKLRSKLGESGSVPRYISTVRGVGYRFELPARRWEPVLSNSGFSARVEFGPDLLVNGVLPEGGSVLGFGVGDVRGRYLPFSCELPWADHGAAVSTVAVLLDAGVTSWSGRYVAPHACGVRVPVRVDARLVCGPAQELAGMALELSSVLPG